MRQRTSAGLLMYRWRSGSLEVLIVHPGGPYFETRDNGHWTLPKGEPEDGEDLLTTAVREFEEETGFEPSGPYIELGSILQKGGKVVHAWAFEGDCDPTRIQSNTMHMEWPLKSGRWQEVPEVDRGGFFNLEAARQKLKAAQIPLLDRLAEKLGSA